jgi:hypothetical protein
MGDSMKIPETDERIYGAVLRGFALTGLAALCVGFLFYVFAGTPADAAELWHLSAAKYAQEGPSMEASEVFERLPAPDAVLLGIVMLLASASCVACFVLIFLYAIRRNWIYLCIAAGLVSVLVFAAFWTG